MAAGGIAGLAVLAMLVPAFYNYFINTCEKREKDLLIHFETEINRPGCNKLLALEKNCHHIYKDIPIDYLNLYDSLLKMD